MRRIGRIRKKIKKTYKTPNGSEIEKEHWFDLPLYDFGVRMFDQTASQLSEIHPIPVLFIEGKKGNRNGK